MACRGAFPCSQYDVERQRPALGNGGARVFHEKKRRCAVYVWTPLPPFFLVWRGLLERGPNALRSLQEAQEETRMRARDGGGKRETVNRDARRFFYGKFETVCVIRFVSLGTAPPFRLSLSFFCFSPRRKTHTTENWTFSVRLFSRPLFFAQILLFATRAPRSVPVRAPPTPPQIISISRFFCAHRRGTGAAATFF